MASSSIQFNGMRRWGGRTALVTGCSSGIGSAITKDLLHYGVKVIGCARSLERITPLVEECTKAGLKGTLVPFECDVGVPAQIEEMFQWIEKEHGGIDICVNNAGVGSMTALLDMRGEEMKDLLCTNVVGPVLCANLAVKSMETRDVNDGHIINISSVLGHNVTGVMNFYSATKHAITALTKGLSMELAAKGSRIKVTQISPGRTETGAVLRVLGDEEKSRKFYASMENLQPQDVTDAVIHTLSAASQNQVYDIILQPTNVGGPGAYHKK